MEALLGFSLDLWDVGDVGRFLETFTIESWLELMHQRERVTHADEILLDRVRHLLAEAPRITLSISSARPHWTWKKHSGASDGQPPPAATPTVAPFMD